MTKAKTGGKKGEVEPTRETTHRGCEKRIKKLTRYWRQTQELAEAQDEQIELLKRSNALLREEIQELEHELA